MKRYASLILAGLVAVLGMTALASSAEAQPTAYPTHVLKLKLTAQTVVSGKTFTVTATANVNCDSITVTWHGQSATAAGSTITHTFTAPNVKVPTVITLHATCIYTSTSGSAGAAISATTQSLRASANVTVLPVSSGVTIPNTGGPSIGWLIAGAAAVLAGVGAMFMGRRRRDHGAAH